jgi:uncharacterized protein
MNTHHHIDYIELPAMNLEAMKAFYGAVFGWTFEDYGPDYVAFSGAGLEGGFAPVVKRPPRGGALVILYSDDLDVSEKAVRDAGGEVLERISFPGGSRFGFIDPSGNALAIWTKS